ncbi:zinc/manganese transport system substrate-binding protein [Dietzia kunjamensis subsp. schimae]|uniref:Zinc/manganese transport system substrate-binding protein n=1 Tax=Dietzia kunjamensis subsp. schimae TaxID=498198 RepID=A0ABY1MYW5_9ACTN|nr:zinc ABC transporter substrate-binding protein [Dietzia kunjamensis]SMO52993.1 zinc/manganese transport system substrate-binding protein [Dietzia kunjamensis subsp. schimae]
MSSSSLARTSPARTSPARTPRALALAASVLLGGSVLTACVTDGDAGAGDDGPTVVASTTVYADIAEQVAGGNASVESVISDPAADPHSYEASPADAAAVAGADLVVYNGAGYDAFVDMALDNAGDVPVVRGVDEFERVTGASVDGHDHGQEDHAEEDHAEEDHADSDDHADGDHSHEAAENEHVWFSLPTAAAVAERVAEELAAIDSGNAEQYRDNARAFADALTPLEAQLDEIHDRGHFPYAQTERVGAHLFEAAHLTDLTPRGFLASVEDDTDPSAADLAAMLDLLAERRVAFLAFNTQTETSVTARLRDAAEDADLVVVDLTETLPEGVDYIGWMTGIVDDVSGALADATPVGDGGH